MWSSRNTRLSPAGAGLPLVALLALALPLAAGCGDDTLTRPAVERSNLAGTWSGGGSLYKELEWTLTQRGFRDSIVGEGYMDAPGFLDGYPPGPAPRYRIRGRREGLFIRLLLVPEDGDARTLDFRGVLRRPGEVRGEVFLRGFNNRIDAIRVFLEPADTVGGS